LYIERDITERKQAEEALRESEEQHRSLFESMAQGAVYQDAVGSIVAANPAAERILGLSLDQMQGRTSMDPHWRAIHEDGSAFPGDRHPAMVSLRTGREVSDVVMGVFNPTSGSYRWMTVNAVPQFRPGEGKPYRVFATFDDVTARKRAEEELREARDYLENLFGYANAPIVVWDAEQRVTRFNRAFEELTGRTAAEVVGERLELLFPEDERRAQTLELVTRASAGERWRVVEIPILHAGGEVRTVLWNSATLYADGGVTPVATIAQGQDISERKRAEQALARLNDELVDEAAALAEANATITRIAATDDLTGLANRRCFYESLEKAVSLARRHGSPLALASFDLDGLKRVNDGSGHEAGDEVLASFAALLAALCRAEDLPGRLGGDEFSVLLPGIELGGARGLAERVLAAVRSSEALAARGVTVSAGVAQWTPGELPDDLLRRADEALYAAKRGGGDAVAGGG
jgi:diguanylate cyclase (GGDEF)-like protein/PAS domain S-box-containing protein